MTRREAKFQTLFRHWLKAHPQSSAAYELKQTTNLYIPFQAVPDHQLIALKAAKSLQGILYKAPDDSRGIKPFDLFYLRESGAYVVIRYPDLFCIIDVDVFIQEKETNKRSSLTMKRAQEIACNIVGL